MSVYTECDVSPMKQQVKADLKDIAQRIQACLDAIDNEDFCLLAEFEHIKHSYRKMESRAATFYLNCYLSPFTDKYTDLSVGIRHLSERRHGALIAVERKDPLEPMVQPGTPIAASVSHSLLESIFYPGSPLHDGAVLIRGNQIVSARNVLPLTRAPLHEQGWGTRHRAAVGLTEQSDAIVLVVSEETGKCSFAAGGVLYPVMST